jgi:hypothetical protein
MSQQAHVPTPLRCEPAPPIRTSARLRTAILAIMMSSLAAWMGYDLKRYPCEHAFHHEIDSPVLAIELASTRVEVETVLAPACASYSEIYSQEEQRAAAYIEARKTAHSALLRDTIADCFFIPLYTLFIWSFGSLFAVDNPKPRVFLRRALALATIATAVFDYVENIGIFRSLALGPSDILAQWTTWPSRFKWTMFAVSLLLTFVILLRSQNPMYSLATRRLFALGYLVTGALLAMGVWRTALLGLGVQIYAFIVILQIIALLGPYIAPLFPPDAPAYEDDFCQRRKKENVILAVHE